jgi:hypothetical protein
MASQCVGLAVPSRSARLFGFRVSLLNIPILALTLVNTFSMSTTAKVKPLRSLCLCVCRAHFHGWLQTSRRRPSCRCP